MATTSARLALDALDAMREAGVRFALLHGRDRLLAGEVSDVDLVVGEPASVIVRRVRRDWLRRGLVPVVLWPYDIGGAATIFVATEGATDGIQFDLLYDPEGHGTYRVRSGPLLDAVDTTLSLPQVSEEHRIIYLWRKRSVKDQADHRAALLEEAKDIEPTRLMTASTAITGSQQTAVALLDGQPTTRPGRFAQPVARATWAARRLSKPVGFWAHTPDTEAAADVCLKFGRFLVTAQTGPVPATRRRLGWWMTEVQPVRLRPGLYISHGPAPGRLRPDLLTSSQDPIQVARAVTAAMSDRL